LVFQGLRNQQELHGVEEAAEAHQEEEELLSGELQEVAEDLGVVLVVVLGGVPEVVVVSAEVRREGVVVSVVGAEGVVENLSSYTSHDVVHTCTRRSGNTHGSRKEW